MKTLALSAVLLLSVSIGFARGNKMFSEGVRPGREGTGSRGGMRLHLCGGDGVRTKSSLQNSCFEGSAGARGGLVCTAGGHTGNG